jgi:hypothetical protein
VPDLPSPPAALRRRAAADPESPFLFWPEGWNWRWWSWRQVAEQVDRWRVPLAALPPGALVGFAGGAYPDAIPQDLAVQEAGMTAVPVAAGLAGIPGEAGEAGGPGLEASCQEGAAAGCDAWLELVAGEPRLRQPGAPGPAALSGEGADKGAGGVMAVGADRARRWLASADVVTAAARLESAIAAEGRPWAGDRRARQILVAGQPLEEWPARLLTIWAILAGAALVLQSDAALRLGTVRWARPTVFHGSAAEIAELRRQLEESRQPRWWGGWRRRARPAFGRLRILFQSSEPAASDLAFWQERGARLLRLPGLGD